MRAGGEIGHQSRKRDPTADWGAARTVFCLLHRLRKEGTGARTKRNTTGLLIAAY
ncbi:hypothetical protein KI387_025854, partial [Taxus chinensis]